MPSLIFKNLGNDKGFGAAEILGFNWKEYRSFFPQKNILQIRIPFDLKSMQRKFGNSKAPFYRQ